MPDVRDSASMIEAAQIAVGNGDHVEAERLLRQAAAIQEAALGPSHPDLATTLNNLAFVCERLEKLDDAERGYRRAHAIAVASLSPRHPFTRTSLSNLVEFCAARGIPIWTPPVTPAADDAFDDEVTSDAPAKPVVEEAAVGTSPVEEFEFELSHAPEAPPEQVVAAGRLLRRAMAVAALGIAAIVVVSFARHGQGGTSPVPAPGLATSSGSSRATGAALNGEPSPGPRADSSAVSRADQSVANSAESSFDGPATGARAADPTVTVLNAQLCGAIEKTGSPDWQCASVGGEGPPGAYIFYTRILTDAPTTVEHRWYFAGRLHQAMRLRVSPNAANGYRTFSSNRVSPERTGEWKVELRAGDGAVLQEARFLVR